jgi:hypothetical protein
MFDLWFLFVLAAFLVCWAVAYVRERIRRWRNRWRITSVSPQCERAGSQGEFYRRLRHGGVR